MRETFRLGYALGSSGTKISKKINGPTVCKLHQKIDLFQKKLICFGQLVYYRVKGLQNYIRDSTA